MLVIVESKFRTTSLVPLTISVFSLIPTKVILGPFSICNVPLLADVMSIVNDCPFQTIVRSSCKSPAAAFMLMVISLINKSPGFASKSSLRLSALPAVVLITIA